MLNYIPLHGKYSNLVPIDKTHLEALTDLHNSAKEQIFALSPPYSESFAHYLEEAITAQSTKTTCAYVILKKLDNKCDQVCGMTRFLDYEPRNKSVEIGSTWYHPDHWGTRINPDAKLTLLTQAFEKMQLHRVQFKTDSRNTRSQAAIKKLGAKYEGTLRRHRILPDGTRRDSVYFSIIKEEWPEVKARLIGRLNQY